MTNQAEEQPSVIGELIFGSRNHVFRFEALPVYSMDEERPALEAWLRGEKFEWPTDVLEFVAATRADINRGVTHTRVRLVPEPPTDYFRFESEFYPLLVAAGVDVRLLTIDDYRALGEPSVGDFYTFDSARAVQLLYDAKGGWLGERELTGDDCEGHINLASRMMAASVPFKPAGR